MAVLPNSLLAKPLLTLISAFVASDLRRISAWNSTTHVRFNVSDDPFPYVYSILFFAIKFRFDFSSFHYVEFITGLVHEFFSLLVFIRINTSLVLRAKLASYSALDAFYLHPRLVQSPVPPDT